MGPLSGKQNLHKHVGSVFDLFKKAFVESWIRLSQEKRLLNTDTHCPSCNAPFYNVSSQPVSVHIPLHRLFAKLLLAAWNKFSISPTKLISERFQINSSLLIIEEPLRIRVFIAQSRRVCGSEMDIKWYKFAFFQLKLI